MADFIRTVSGVMFAPLEPNAEDIKIEDIAHSLSMICRANGHYRKFYSVGAHCINCYDEAVSRREKYFIQLACLLHDAAEAYISDVTRPIKKNLPDYNRFEEELASVIYQKYLGRDLEKFEAEKVKMIDDAMLYHEFYEFTAYRLFEEVPYVAATPNYFQGPPEMVEANFLKIFYDLIDKVKEEEQAPKAPKLSLSLERLYKED